MKFIKNLYTWIAGALLLSSGFILSSCNEDMPASSYYTFKKQMMSDYLQDKDREFSLFAQIVKKAGRMDLLASYGMYTCFAPTDSAVRDYLVEVGLESVEQLSFEQCDTITRTHIISERVYNTTDFEGLSNIPHANLLDRYISLAQVAITEENELTGRTDTIGATYQLNGRAEILYNHKNDSVENGIIQPINAVLLAAGNAIVDVVADNEEVKLFSEALKACGLDNLMQKYQDTEWNPDLYEDKVIYSGAQDDYCHIPQTKYYGYTLFICPDDVLEEKYGITDLQSFYNYAVSIYGNPYDHDLDLSVAEDFALLRQTKNPLRRIVAYHCMNRKAVYDKWTTICTINTNVVSPVEWYTTMDSLTTIKMERVMQKNQLEALQGVHPGLEKNMLVLNSKFKYDNNDHTAGHLEADGVMVHRPKAGQEGLNGYYFITDGLANYGAETQEVVFNDRIRMDMYTFFPELMNNNIRTDKTNTGIATTSQPDADSKNYLFPNGYLDNVTINEDGDFLYQGCHNTFWSYEGDEFNLASDKNSYDITFNLPSVPTGTYQLRLGFADMPTRGICQFYFDGNPVGMPFDMRSDNFATRTGFVELSQLEAGKQDVMESTKKTMHNLGWYHGPKSVFNFTQEGTADGNLTAGKSYFCNNGGHTIRYVLGNEPIYIDGSKQHTVRIKSVWAVGTALVMMDYFEFVPKSIYDISSTEPEDDY